MLKKLLLSLQKKDPVFQQYLKYKDAVDQYLDYLSEETHLPVAHVVKQNNIRKYQQMYNFQVFVETGTFLGDMVEAQKKYFKKIISVELGEDLYRKAVQRFQHDPHVTLLQGDSGLRLKEVVATLDEPALFWLDGHYSAGITAKADKNTPVLEELKTIFSSSLPHGILIDDARHFVGQEDYPSIDELCFLVKELAPQRKVEVADDIIRVMP
ncbi:MAG TPA: hypothetical protein VK014_12290 [Cyclobacteriaceae bacterium]|nr:hypothetical protein [Cyclobacteriaceae bacterium]